MNHQRFDRAHPMRLWKIVSFCLLPSAFCVCGWLSLHAFHREVHPPFRLVPTKPPKLSIWLVAIEPVDHVIFQLVFVNVVFTERTTAGGNTGFMCAIGLFADKWMPLRKRASLS